MDISNSSKIPAAGCCMPVVTQVIALSISHFFYPFFFTMTMSGVSSEKMLCFEDANTKTRRKDIFNINHKVQLAAKLERKKRKESRMDKKQLENSWSGVSGKKERRLGNIPARQENTGSHQLLHRFRLIFVIIYGKESCLVIFHPFWLAFYYHQFYFSVRKIVIAISWKS